LVILENAYLDFKLPLHSTQ